jgi:hypothetical protein
MSYRIGGIDVHKKMLAVVMSDVEIESEYQFERRMFGSKPERLPLLAAWLLEQEVEEVVMESAAQYWNQFGELWNGIGNRSARSGKAQGAGPERCIWRRRSPIAGGETQEGFRRCRTLGEAAGSGTDRKLLRDRVSPLGPAPRA